MSHRATITITTRALTICFANCTWQNEMDSTLSHVYLYMDVYWIDWLVRVAGNIFYILTIKFIKEIFYLYNKTKLYVRVQVGRHYLIVSYDPSLLVLTIFSNNVVTCRQPIPRYGPRAVHVLMT